MNHWDMPTKIGELNGKKGYIFKNSIPKDDIEREILRFIKHNALDEVLEYNYRGVSPNIQLNSTYVLFMIKLY